MLKFTSFLPLNIVHLLLYDDLTKLTRKLEFVLLQNLSKCQPLTVIHVLKSILLTTLLDEGVTAT